jgi:hypothetical protein
MAVLISVVECYETSIGKINIPHMTPERVDGRKSSVKHIVDCFIEMDLLAAVLQSKGIS